MIGTVLSLLGAKNIAIVVALIAGAIFVTAVYNRGYGAGKRDIISDIESARVESVEEKQKIDNEVQSLRDEDLLKRAMEAIR